MRLPWTNFLYFFFKLLYTGYRKANDDDTSIVGWLFGFDGWLADDDDQFVEVKDVSDVQFMHEIINCV